jgi:hypothetical protein
VTPKTRAALKDELSGKDFDKVELMLDSGYLSWETVKQKATEQHYELKDPADASKGWGLESYEWDTKYDIAYTRTQLRVRVKIGFKGQTATAAHKQLWRAGIRNRWNGHFHLDNGTTKLAFDFDPVWVNSGAQHTIELHPPVTTGWRENSGNWYVGPTANADPTKTRDSTTGDTAAHEFGHLIGLEDEYRLTAADFQRLVGTAPTAADKAGLGAPGFSHPGLMTAGIGDVEARHLTTFVDWLNAHRRPGEARYSVKAGP